MKEEILWVVYIIRESVRIWEREKREKEAASSIWKTCKRVGMLISHGFMEVSSL